MYIRKLSFFALILGVLVFSGCATTPDKEPMTDMERENKVQELITTAKEDADNNNYAVALLHYEQALQLDKNNQTALTGAGDVAYAIGKYPEARDYYERALEQAPSNVDAMEGKALSNLKLEQYATAREGLKTVIQSDSTRWRSLNALGVLSDLDSRYSRAQEYYRAALEHNSENPKILNNLGYSLIMSHKYREAEKTLERAHTLDPDYFRARNNYAIAMAWQKKYQPAVEVLVDAVPYEVAYNNVGYIAYLNNDLDSAEFYLKKAISTSPSYYAEAARNLEKVQQAQEKMKRKGSLP